MPAGGATPTLNPMPAPDYAVIGGGIVGLTIARELAIRGASVTVLEKEPHLGLHASGRNSGVLHAGFYYAPDSLKARLTARGNQLLRAFCDGHDVPVRSCGKVVVASSPEQLPALDELARLGQANGVRLETIDERQLADLEPLARTVERAIWSPNTAVADPRQVTAALQPDLTARGVTIRTSTTVTQPPEAGHVVNAAGLYADRVAQWYGFCDDYVMMPFKGLYWYGNARAPHLQRHVYPVPDPRNPFLGVHFTVTPDGGVKVGPTAIPVLSREAYSWNFRADEAREIASSFPAFLRGGHHDVPALLRSELPKYSRRWLEHQARALVPSATGFTIKGTPGIRAQLMHKTTGKLEMDFLVRGDERSTHVLNAVSPAWTASLAFAELVVDGMAERGAA